MILTQELLNGIDSVPREDFPLRFPIEDFIDYVIYRELDVPVGYRMVFGFGHGVEGARWVEVRLEYESS